MSFCQRPKHSSARSKHVIRDCARARNVKSKKLQKITVSVSQTHGWSYRYIHIYIARAPVVRLGGFAPAHPINAIATYLASHMHFSVA